MSRDCGVWFHACVQLVICEEWRWSRRWLPAAAAAAAMAAAAAAAAAAEKS